MIDDVVAMVDSLWTPFLISDTLFARDIVTNLKIEEIGAAIVAELSFHEFAVDDQVFSILRSDDPLKLSMLTHDKFNSTVCNSVRILDTPVPIKYQLIPIK